MLRKINFLLEESEVAKIKGLGVTMTEFLRSAIAQRLQSLGVDGQSTVSAEQLQALTDRVSALEALTDRVSALEASLAKHEKFCQQEFDDMPELVANEMVTKLKPSCFYHEE